MGIRQGVPVDGPEPDLDRERYWSAIFRDGHGQGVVILQHHAVREPGEHLTEQVPERRIGWAEWERSHSEYGLTLDGEPLDLP